jgi:putative ABC transport system ATP-binding protein
MTIVEVQNLTKIYGSGDTAVTALDHVSFEVDAGEFVAIMGPSGCGKSTLLHLLAGLDRPSAGQVLIAGQNLSELNDKQATRLRRQKIGLVFQFFNLIPVLSAVENVALPITLDGIKQSEARARATSWLGKIGMNERLTHRPDQLSGGQQQRVAVARALVSEPQIILADEPTGNLDTHAGEEVAMLLQQASKVWGRSIIMVTHDPRIAAYAERIIFLKDGQITEQTRLETKNHHNAALVADKMKELG